MRESTLEQNLNAEADDEQVQDEIKKMKKIRDLKINVFVKLIFATAVIILVATSKEPCSRGWDAKQFMYVISGLYFLDVLFILMQIACVKSNKIENPCVTFLLMINFCTQVGFFIAGNVGYY